jgi:hypothetical protein
MPKGPRLSTKDKHIIDQIYNRNRGSKAEAIRQLVCERLGREIGLSTIQRELALLKKDKNRGSTDPIDNQWSLASLREYPINGGSIQFLLFLQATFEDNAPKELKEYFKQQGHKAPFLSNRLAIWIGRLLTTLPIEFQAKSEPLPKDTPPEKVQELNKWPEWVDDLVTIAMFYSDYEIGCELKGVKPVNTINFDAPTLGQIKLNILRYNLEIHKRKGIPFAYSSEAIEKLKSLKVEDLVEKGRLPR